MTATSNTARTVQCRVAAIAFGLLPIVVSAQPSFREHRIAFGITLSLPATWSLDSATALAATRERSLDAMRSSQLRQLREFAADNQNALVFRAQDRAESANTANMNVTVSPDMKRDAFVRASGSEIDILVHAVCQAFVAQTVAIGGDGACERHEVRTFSNRRVVVIYETARVPRAGLDNRRTVVLIPGDGILLTLSVSLRRDKYDHAIPDAVLASIRLPEGG